MKIVIFESIDKRIGILIPAPNLDANEVAKKDVPYNSKFMVMDAEMLSCDFDFLLAYEFSMTGPILNINRAKEIWLNRYRLARAPILEFLDVAFMRAVELGDTAKQAEIAAQKQALRDVTLTPLPEDLDGIKNTWPEILGPRPT